jgi:hypothetical protein
MFSNRRMLSTALSKELFESSKVRYIQCSPLNSEICAASRKNAAITLEDCIFWSTIIRSMTMVAIGFHDILSLAHDLGDCFVFRVSCLADSKGCTKLTPLLAKHAYIFSITSFNWGGGGGEVGGEGNCQ